jgi:thymidine kinase
MTYNYMKHTGSLDVICGPMFSGKSEELIRRLRRAVIAKQKIIVFKHAFDNRAQSDQVRSHNGSTLDAYPTDSIAEIRDRIHNAQIDLVGIDEIQFYSADIIHLINELIDAGKQVIVAGLDRDFRSIPFGPMPTLLAIADSITKLSAICTSCGSHAYFTQRLVNNQPARFDDPIIQIGAQDAYQARCRSCYVIDKRSNFLV